MEETEHKKLGIELFNATWDLIDKKDRSQEDNFEMMNRAHASCYHWKHGGGTTLNEARGEWQLSRVYALLNMGESALLHGRRSLDLCLAANIGDLDAAFACEAVARAYSVLKDPEKREEFKRRAREVAISSDEDREYLQKELASIV